MDYEIFEKPRLVFVPEANTKQTGNDLRKI
jgi:hypothetical protein